MSWAGHMEHTGKIKGYLGFQCWNLKKETAWKI